MWEDGWLVLGVVKVEQDTVLLELSAMRQKSVTICKHSHCCFITCDCAVVAAVLKLPPHSSGERNEIPGQKGGEKKKHSRTSH